ncbi:hypothetical protein [Adhaeretor mobilis]|nr:hypothetical protein [Adhaeretor mobilis]
MRFQSSKPDRVQPVSRGLRLKLWLLLGMLAMVGMMMRHLQQPATAEKLGRLFSLQENASPVGEERKRMLSDELDFRESAASDVLKIDPSKEPHPEESANGETTRVRMKQAASVTDELRGDDDLTSLLDNVEDNALFLKSEEEAWLAVLEAVRSEGVDGLSEKSIGQLAYAQLIEQPKVYRGRVVTVHGTVLREEELTPVDNELGIANYHRLVISPTGGGQWPFVVYAISLPETFPRGEKLREEVTVHGYFFKNWSYPHSQGYGLAPIVVANSVEWQPRPPSAELKVKSTAELPPWWAIASVAVAALLLVRLLSWNTRRVSTVSKAREAANAASLQRLAERETGD